MATLTLSNIYKSYDNSTHTINDVSLAVNNGDFVVIVGPSGCGKSTLLRLVAGLERIDSGELCIDDQRVNDKEPKDRGIAMVFQNYALYPHMSCFDNIAYSLKLQNIDKNTIKQRVESLAQQLELSDCLNKKPHELSGGQRQRVAIGRAMVRNPKIFLFDEPLSNLDAKLRVHMRMYIKQLQRDLHTTSLYVTHDQIEAMTMADTLVVMHQGEIQQVDTPNTIYEQPCNTFVASFIGSPEMNLCTAVVGTQEVMIADTPVATLPLKLKDCSTVTLGIRPEHIVMSDRPSVNTTLTATVQLIEHMGNNCLVHSIIDNTETTLSILSDNKTLTEGNSVYLNFPDQYIHWFDSTTGTRIDCT